MAKITQEISLDVTDVNGDDVHMIITAEEAQELYNELVKVLNIITGFSYPDGVRSPYDQRIWNPNPQCDIQPCKENFEHLYSQPCMGDSK